MKYKYQFKKSQYGENSKWGFSLIRDRVRGEERFLIYDPQGEGKKKKKRDSGDTFAARRQSKQPNYAPSHTAQKARPERKNMDLISKEKERERKGGEGIPKDKRSAIFRE